MLLSCSQFLRDAQNGNGNDKFMHDMIQIVIEFDKTFRFMSVWCVLCVRCYIFDVSCWPNVRFNFLATHHWEMFGFSGFAFIVSFFMLFVGTRQRDTSFGIIIYIEDRSSVIQCLGKYTCIRARTHTSARQSPQWTTRIGVNFSACRFEFLFHFSLHLKCVKHWIVSLLAMSHVCVRIIRSHAAHAAYSKRMAERTQMWIKTKTWRKQNFKVLVGRMEAAAPRAPNA